MISTGAGDKVITNLTSVYTTGLRRLTGNKVVLLGTQEGNEKGGHLTG